MNNVLDMIEVNPTSTATATVIWLHGLGADGNDFAPMVPELQIPNTLPIRFVFPNAPLQPVTINGGYVMRSWYDIVSLEINRHADQTGIARSVQQVNQVIENEINNGIPAEKIILAGFSQGAVMALTAGLGYQKKLGGILALSGYLPFAADVLSAANQANKSTPIFLAHGTQDAVVPYFLGQAAHAELIKHQHPVSWHSYPMPHSVCAEEIQDIREWLITRLNKPE